MNKLPEALLRSLLSGGCIAFVGSGFAGAAKLPSWSGLLEGLARRDGFDPSRHAHVLALLQEETPHAYDEAAQVIEDTLGKDAFAAELHARLGRPEPTDAMQRRLEWLHGIPFRAILTTNFDGVFDGETPNADAFRDILRPEGIAPWWERLFHLGPPPRVPVLKIHGDVRKPHTVVITRRDYRRLLYENPGYSAFLRAVLANHTVLYLGFSFTDAYLNELRSELLALVGYRGETPVAYAIINDISAIRREHFRRHEGIEILTYDTKGGTDFSGFDTLLKQLHDQTNPIFHFGSLLQNKRLLWLDPNPGNNEHLTNFFVLSELVANTPLDSFSVEPTSTAEEALSLIKANQEASTPFHLVITHWGSRSKPPVAIRLLEGMRAQGLRSPVLIFSTRKGANARKPHALALGAQAYCFSDDGLLRSIQRILSPEAEPD